MLDYLFRQLESPEFEQTINVCSGRVCFRNACHQNEYYKELVEQCTQDELEARIHWLASVPFNDNFEHPFDKTIGAYLLIYKERGFNNYSILKSLDQWFARGDFFWASNFNIDMDMPHRMSEKFKKQLELFSCKSKKNT